MTKLKTKPPQNKIKQPSKITSSNAIGRKYYQDLGDTARAMRIKDEIEEQENKDFLNKAEVDNEIFD